jgi:hypothetical protein
MEISAGFQFPIACAAFFLLGEIDRKNARFLPTGRSLVRF